MAVITTGAHPKALWPGIKEWFGLKYNEKPLQCMELFEQVSSDKAYEEDVESTSFGLAPLKPEGTSLSFDDHNQTNVAKYVHATYGLGYQVTMEELQDCKYAAVGKARSGMLAFSMRQSKEIVGANIFNNGFDSNFTGADGKEMLATNHPTRDGDQSNELAVAADFSEAALEDLLIQIRQTKNSRGLRIQLIGQKLIIPNNLMFEAQRVTMSELQSGTANNDVNALRRMGMLPEGIVINDYFTDTDAWFIGTDAPEGLKYYTRMSVAFDQDNEFNTKNACASAIERYAFGWSDWRGIFGSPGV